MKVLQAAEAEAAALAAKPPLLRLIEQLVALVMAAVREIMAVARKVLVPAEVRFD